MSAVKTWEDRMQDSGRRECEGLAIELMQAEIADLRRALDEKPLGPTIAEMQAGGALPAFPQIARDGDLAVSEGGLSMRDYFAAKALQGLLSMPNEWRNYVIRDGAGTSWKAEATRAAYELADAMLAARGAA